MSLTMAAVVARPAPLNDTSSSLRRAAPTALPNRHIPVCSPGPRPAGRRLSSSPPTSPATPAPLSNVSSLLCPAAAYPILQTDPVVHGLTAKQLHKALDHAASQPLPAPHQVFPWLHGLHPDNALQLSFFAPGKKSHHRTPRCLRSITIVKVGGDLTSAKIRGAIAPDELLAAAKLSEQPSFLDVDPKSGFSVRNFQIQAAKMATVGDIVVYGDDNASIAGVLQLAERLAQAQRAWRARDSDAGVDRPSFSTFAVTDPWSKFEDDHPQIVAIDGNGHLTGNVLDFFHAERTEMRTMSAATEIARNVWLGPTPEAVAADHFPEDDDGVIPYEYLIECNEMASLPNKGAFAMLEQLANSDLHKDTIPQLDFPGSGSIMPPTWSQQEADGLLSTMQWIYRQANGLSSPTKADMQRGRKDSKVGFDPMDGDGDASMSLNDIPPTKRYLIHCADGYTETTLLAVAYYMYANGVPLHQAYIDLHKKHKRNFFAYPSDVNLLTVIQPRILQASPAISGFALEAITPPTPEWMRKVDGSIPSRITDYMYLGNLAHANNPGLLQAMGIGQVLSVGETLDWSEDAMASFGDRKKDFACDSTTAGKWLFIGGVQDNGVDPLTNEFERCLDFIRKGREAGTATLVHCRVGVSRSATICIAEVMNELGLSFPKAYCFVRARRLNVIIQPHLRFSYELLKYEEFQAQKRGKEFRRELEWATVAREIAEMNRPYSRQ